MSGRTSGPTAGDPPDHRPTAGDPPDHRPTPADDAAGTPTAELDGRLRPLRLLRATPLAVWLACLLMVLLSAGYALAVPLLHGPDEHAHVDLILNTDRHLGVDPYAGMRFQRRTYAALPLVGLVAIDWRVAPEQPWRGLDAARAVPRPLRPTYAELAPPGDVGIPNTAASHPPLYYALADGVTALVRDGRRWSWDQHVSALRLGSAVLVGVVPWCAYWATRRLVGSERRARAAALLTLAIPQLTHIGGVVNNDALMVALAALLLVALAWIATGDTSVRTALLAGVGTGLGALTKVFLLGAPLWVAAAYLVAWRRGAPRRRVLVALFTAGGVALLAGGWWPLRHLIVAGTPAPRPFLYPEPAAPDTPLLPWLAAAVDRLTSTFWGHFGVEQFPLPNAAIVVASVATAAAAVWGWRQLRGQRAAAAVLCLPLLTTLAMIGYAAWPGYLRTGLPVGLHGRYLAVGVVGIAVLVAAGLRAPRLWAAVSALGMQAVGVWVVVRNYWAGEGLLGELEALLAWAPWRARWTVSLWALTLTVAGATVTAALRGVRTPADGGPHRSVVAPPILGQPDHEVRE